MIVVGVDVGGTFTDLLLVDRATGLQRVHKVPSTPADPSQAVIQGIREVCELCGLEVPKVGHVLHGTTVATNAMLEHKGAVTGMITTEGYRDILHIGRHQRPQNYSIQQEIPWQERSLVKRRHRLTVKERLVPPSGEVLVPLDEDGVREAARQLKAAGVEAIVIGFLFSYLDPRHEERARAIVLEEWPDVFVTTSASVSAQFREFERFTTAAVNAFIGPPVAAYVGRLSERLRSDGLDADLHVMCSNGGVATAAMVVEKPVQTLLSGPAAGVMGGSWAAALSGFANAITFDVGGTSADIGIARDGRFVESTARDTAIAGFPVLAPMIDVHTIGAGGGSIARMDPTGGFRVGPESAGARPGPAAYGHGGNEPTTTDAHLVLGRLDPDRFLGGAMTLDAEAAWTVMARLGEQLGVSVEEAAEGVLRLLNAGMANAIFSRTVQKGIDPREFVLVAMGGAGPLHACEVATSLGMATVLVPPHPGVTSAVGLLTTDLKYDAVRTAFEPGEGADLARIERLFAEMTDRLEARLLADNIPPAARSFARSADIRYAGQGYELRIDIADDPLGPASLELLLRAFHDRHEEEYGHSFSASPIEIVNLRVSARGRMPRLERAAAFEGPPSDDPITMRPVLFRTEAGLERFETPVFERARLGPGAAKDGPAIILQLDTTTVVPPGWTWRVDEAGSLVLKAMHGEMSR